MLFILRQASPCTLTSSSTVYLATTLIPCPFAHDQMKWSDLVLRSLLFVVILFRTVARNVLVSLPTLE